MATSTKTKTTAPKAAKTRARSTPHRDSHGRFEANHHSRSAAIGVAAGLAAVAGGVAAALRFGLLDRLLPGNAEHAAPDLAPGEPHNDGSARAPEAFRPDPTAPVTAAERDGLRPAPAVSTGFTEEKRSEAVH